MPEIVVPQRWKLREYQAPLYGFMRNGGKRAVAIWHRRAGKDQTVLHWTVEAATSRPGLYWHMLPTQKQAKKAIWNGRTKEGIPFLDAFPKEAIAKKREDEMSLTLHNNSIWQCVGSDNYDGLVGSNPIGVVYSEYALSDPASWDFIRPILAENDGWAIFISTPRGRNHLWDMYEIARDNDSWFCEVLRADQTNAITPERIAQEKRDGMSQELIDQEFYCSWDAPLQGSFYGDQMAEALEEGRITEVKHEAGIKVDTWWDLGYNDATSIWFVQRVHQEIHLIDYYESNGQNLEHYAHMLQMKAMDEKYVYGHHIWPHDGKHGTLASKGKPLSTMMFEAGVDVETQPQHDVLPGIQRVRQVMPQCWFDADRCDRGIQALRAYRKQLDESRSDGKNPYFKPKPLHDWSSHAADAFRTGVVADLFGGKIDRADADRYGRRRGSGSSSSWAA